ncbi:tetratricopeptide repeat protein [Thiohalomonas denitrificans]|uniref:tetratricopeptide repeat protein n=1 Tax=Thiohalomonas denitrificans TaxID=415747 RepID=UPI0026EAB4D9|nr:tetratricopeptide repeat protein [Thiohalomonas denitrificans]
MKRQSGSIRIILFGALLTLCGTLSAAPSEGRFERGLTAFRAGDFGAACRFFEEARRGGLDTPALDYNLGVCHYRLSNYRQAREAFERVAVHPPLKTLAHYNLGLVALDVGDRSAAGRWFSLVSRNSSDPKLKTLAESQLEGLRKPPADSWIAAVSAGGGYDDNLVDPINEAGTSTSDWFLEAYAFALGPLSGTIKDGVKADATVFATRYQDLSAYDLTFWQGGVAIARPLTGWDTEAGVQLEQSTLDGDDYLRGVSAVFTGDSALKGPWQLRLRYRHTRFDALSSRYDQLEGSRDRLEARGRRQVDDRRLTLLYRLDRNDRNDLRTSTTFTSYSPVRHTFRGGYDTLVAPNWNLQTELEYRTSRYSDDNVLADESTIRREEDRYRADLRLSRRLDKRWRVVGRYEFTDNRANLDRYDYTRNLYTVNLTAAF